MLDPITVAVVSSACFGGVGAVIGTAVGAFWCAKRWRQRHLRERAESWTSTMMLLDVIDQEDMEYAHVVPALHLAEGHPSSKQQGFDALPALARAPAASQGLCKDIKSGSATHHQPGSELVKWYNGPQATYSPPPKCKLDSGHSTTQLPVSDSCWSQT